MPGPAESVQVVDRPSPAAARTRVSGEAVWVGVIGVELALVFAPTAAWLMDRWTLSVWHNAHGLFIPPLVGWLIWRELKSDRNNPARGSASGFLLLIPGLAAHAIDAGLHTQLLSAMSLLAILPGLSLLLLGIRKTVLIAFPLLFLAFALPIPLGLTEPIHLALRHLGARTVDAIMPMLGITVLVEGTTVHTTRGTLLIADACSGFSTLYAAAAVACFSAYTARTWTRRLMVLALAAPIAIAANALRLVLLVSLVVWYGDAVLSTFLHPLSGMMTFALALPIIFWLGGPVRSQTRR